MNAELIVDCYAGDSCEEHAKLWKMYAAGDMDEDKSSTPIVFDINRFPVGTKIYVEVPVCPSCDIDRELCNCEFNWRSWEEEVYG